MGIIEWGILFIKDLILAMGYPGIAFLMALESACIPIPSEIVMPFAGWLVYDGKMDLILVTLSGAVGCLIGSIAAYLVGLYGGRKFVIKYGRYLLLSQKSLDSAERWFAKYGTSAVFLSRLLPIVRTFISLPAGMAKMKFGWFVALSFIGSVPWCFALAYVGVILGPNWESITGIFRGLDVLIVVVFVAIVVWYILTRRRAKTTSQEE
ncbi:MAG: DedA family protein [Methanomassiliicoccales archaeon]|nr:DedA family protein [Methanomassiliicoccales archaeon]